MHGVRTVFQPATIQIFVAVPCRQLSVTMEGGLTELPKGPIEGRYIPFSQVQLGSGQHGSDPIFLPLSWLTRAHSPAGSCEPGGRLGLGCSVARLAKRSKVRGWGGLRGGGAGQRPLLNPTLGGGGHQKQKCPEWQVWRRHQVSGSSKTRLSTRGTPSRIFPSRQGQDRVLMAMRSPRGHRIQTAGVPSCGFLAFAESVRRHRPAVPSSSPCTPSRPCPCPVACFVSHRPWCPMMPLGVSDLLSSIVGLFELKLDSSGGPGKFCFSNSD